MLPFSGIIGRFAAFTIGETPNVAILCALYLLPYAVTNGTKGFTNGSIGKTLNGINVKMLPMVKTPKPKSSFRHLKQGIQEFHRKYVLVPADKAANNVVVVCRLHYVNTLKQELDGTRAYLETDTDEVSVVNAHLNDLPVKFSVCVNEGQDKLPTMYWLPKLHKRPYKARFIANSSSCTTTELSKLLTSRLTAIKSHVIRYCETVYETSNKNWFWSIKILVRCSIN